jgi:hypothetical protein
MWRSFSVYVFKANKTMISLHIGAVVAFPMPSVRLAKIIKNENDGIAY